MTQIFIKPNILKAVLSHAAKDDVRFYLNGIHFKNRNGVLVVEGTDGQRMIRVTLDNITLTEPLDAIIKRSDIEFILKMKFYSIELEFGEKSVKVANTGMTFELMDGTFPDIDAIIPAQIPRAFISGIYNWDYLSDIRDASNLIFDVKKKTGNDIVLLSDGPTESKYNSGKYNSANAIHDKWVNGVRVQAVITGISNMEFDK